MALNKYSYESDAIVNLYRAAFYLAKGSQVVGLNFLKKAKGKLGTLGKELDSLQLEQLKSLQDSIYWAEKILDEYHKLKHSKL